MKFEKISIQKFYRIGENYLELILIKYFFKKIKKAPLKGGKKCQKIVIYVVSIFSGRGEAYKKLGIKITQVHAKIVD
ncbi:hypothetical protein [Cyclobacterium jeungdonense]|uniref:Uncharacterized protein n=1 Tax=Cyclobacterium jeungdonense TaxID=708087 RepID=A0ABT8C3A3_9BACT|nr:hypothetical protein [Cyclobacterium jeungdonense]MDN3687244.1 hypothetical protein [Cyclobacterium jeungdonense]